MNGFNALIQELPGIIRNAAPNVKEVKCLASSSMGELAIYIKGRMKGERTDFNYEVRAEWGDSPLVRGKISDVIDLIKAHSARLDRTPYVPGLNYIPSSSSFMGFTA